ncbi:NADH-quinone oxidoreductase subunit A [Varunaivibrio sulfuroxidans]|uniref:NADH-quinone oxidoreductase subunit A n=1 Tax=Varunaivibrio sulfuroxidans TaxID=1773489 RepID=A0A4R3JEA6_9PROT|nr:NADH-quinone oxidoreductase subunit A [Varunaivibrio sulfuroxidans]TCS64124.1 NADH dehydrogenase subunit A [Varunaivibrio sulfuroxidans]WES31428.1 NADH-quinone oxidoreductase subunit A [Varunaivibrio sulfuroxidans]
MNAVVGQYFPILVFLGVAFAIAFFMLAASWLIGHQKPDPEKNSAYECGFEAFEDARRPFDVRFYLVSILFIIFDLEIAFLFPWAVSLGKIGLFGFWSMMIFLAILTIGFVYEWKKGALEWE